MVMSNYDNPFSKAKNVFLTATQKL